MKKWSQLNSKTQKSIKITTWISVILIICSISIGGIVYSVKNKPAPESNLISINSADLNKTKIITVVK